MISSATFNLHKSQRYQNSGPLLTVLCICIGCTVYQVEKLALKIVFAATIIGVEKYALILFTHNVRLQFQSRIPT